MDILDTINSPADIKRLSIAKMNRLADEIRSYMLDVISENGGHIASSLGVVELTIAIHHVFNTPIDKIIWDVGHQTYAHKILTGRREQFKSIKRYGGLSGFPKRKESVYDPYNTGHSSTSISLALGEAVGRDLAGKNYKVVAVVGDGSLTGGMVFEALNHAGHIKKDMIIILNDNEQSISENVGALSTYLTEMISSQPYNKFRQKSMELIKSIPVAGKNIFDFMFRFFASFKSFIIPGQLFENLGVRYFGPVDGHNIAKLIEILDRVKEIDNGPKIIHVITKKGKGFDPAESDPCTFHGTGPFRRESGEKISNSSEESYSSVAGRTLAAIGKKDKKVVAITAAMKEGTGLSEFEKIAPDRIFDVGIAEPHAVTFASALASTGLKPFVAIYSSFLQRSYDQMIHDTGIMNLPVRFLIDRAGIVGDDGETHHGLFDVSMIKNIPGFEFFAPSNGKELRDMIYYAWEHSSGPIAIRYPRGTSHTEKLNVDEYEPFIPGQVKVLTQGDDIAILALGDMVHVALEVEAILKDRGYGATVVNILSIKPLDINGIENIIKNSDYFVTLENSYSSGGIGEYIYSKIDPTLCTKRILKGGFPEKFITHGTFNELLKENSIDPGSISEVIIDSIQYEAKSLSISLTK